MVWTVQLLEPVAVWLKGLPADDFARINAAIKVLEETGPSLGAPFVKQIVSAKKHKNLKELRVGAKDKEFRIFFAFDKRRTAILLIGGEKLSFGVKRFYEIFVPKATALLEQYEAEVEKKRLEQENSARSASKKQTSKKGRKGKSR